MAATPSFTHEKVRIRVTVKGDELVYNCRNCFCEHGYGINLRPNGGDLECPHCHAHYVVESGFMRRVGG